MLDRARKIRPNLYVLAELFTGSPDVDNHFVARLGINSIVREAMAAHDEHDLGRIIHRYSGKAVGSVTTEGDFSVVGMEKTVNLVLPQQGPAIVIDCTHDNDTIYHKRTAEDALSTAALVTMSTSAIGSTRGFDELVPFHVSVVHETRPFASSKQLGENAGVMQAKKFLNNLHQEMVKSPEIYVHQEGTMISGLC
jgi:glycogen debranching enzyme